MLTGSWGDTQAQTQIVERHLAEMRAEAEGDRRARETRAARKPRTIRRAVSCFLIAAGEALAA